MTDEPIYTCAVWYVDDRGEVTCEMAGDKDAPKRAASIETYTDGSVLGLQRADGALIRAQEWTAFREERDRMRQRQQESWKNAKVIPTREITDPFTGTVVEVDADDPEWLGRSR